jgi:hypothetical protein
MRVHLLYISVAWQRQFFVIKKPFVRDKFLCNVATLYRHLSLCPPYISCIIIQYNHYEKDTRLLLVVYGLAVVLLFPPSLVDFLLDFLHVLVQDKN